MGYPHSMGVGITCIGRSTPDGDGSEAGGGDAEGVLGSRERALTRPDGDLVPVLPMSVAGHCDREVPAGVVCSS